jgi:hypothetical protein
MHKKSLRTTAIEIKDLISFFVWCLSKTVNKTMNTQPLKCYEKQAKGRQAA